MVTINSIDAPTKDFLQIANNLSDVNNASTSRNNLGLGTAATHNTGDFCQTANNLSDVTAATARTNLGLGTAATHNTGDFCQTANNLSDVTAATARTNLGLGTAATKTASNNSNTNVASVASPPTIGHFAVFTDVNGTIQDGGAQGTMSSQNASSVAITGGTMNGTVIGGSSSADATVNNLLVNPRIGINARGSGDEAIDILFTGTGSSAQTAINFADEDTSNTQNYNIYFTRNNGSVYNSCGSFTCDQGHTYYTASSDKRIKRDVAPLENTGFLIDDIEPVYYKLKNPNIDKIYYGFIAQDLYKVFPNAVVKGDDNEEITIITDEDGKKHQIGVWGIDPSKLVCLLFAEVKSLRARVQALEESQ